MFDFGVEVTFAWLPALISGLASVGGALFANNANRQQARDQMSFQERMAGTQAQRARADFEAAGLNPALAYGTQAAAPMGAKADQQDPLRSGLSTALNVAQAKSQIENVAAQTANLHSDNELKRIELAKLTSRDGQGPVLWEMQRAQAMRDLQQRFDLQPHELRSVKAAADRAEAEAAVRKLDIPKAQAEAWIYKNLGPAVPALGMLGATAKSVAGLAGAGRAMSAMDFARRKLSKYGPARP